MGWGRRCGRGRRGGNSAGTLPEALLLIGDKVVNARIECAVEYPYQLDLGEERKEVNGATVCFCDVDDAAG